MRALTLFGNLPSLIHENTPPWDWLGQLRLSIDPGLIRFLDVVGSGADYFDAALNRQWGTIVVTPLARADFEAFMRTGQAPELSLGFRFFLTDGGVAEASQRYAVQVLDLDDTPPQTLTLNTAGAVPYGVAGATVGALTVTDPDTTAGFSYAIREDDSWLFEVVGATLRLKPGMVLSQADGPLRAVTLDVSDGRQSSAFTVTFGVTDPRAPPGQVVNLLHPGETMAGFSWSGAGVLRADVLSSELRSIQDHGQLLHISVKGGDAVWVEQPRVIDLLDGRIFYTAEGGPSRIWATYVTAKGREPSLASMEALDNWMAVGATERQVARGLYEGSELRGLSNAELPRRLYENSVGWVSEEGAAGWTARLDAGMPPEQLLLEFAGWRSLLGHPAARAEHGIFVPRPHAHEVAALLDAGGYASGPGTRWWTDQINSGTYTLKTLAGAVPSTEGWRVGWGSVDDRSFAASFFRAQIGIELDPSSNAWWGEQLATGARSKADFMAIAVGNLNTEIGQESHWLQRPDAAAFAADWF